MPAGSKITASIFDPTVAWTSYTPTWASFGTQPALGNGTLTGHFMRVGKLIAFEIELVMGSTTTYGTSQYTFTTPTAVNTGACCAAFFEDNSAALRWAGVSTIDAGAGLISRTIFAPGTAGLSGTSPVTLATSDVIRIAGTYEST